MSPIVSNYDLIYKAMSDEDRTKLEATVADVLTRGIKEASDLLTREVEKAVSGLYNQLHCNPWGDVIQENSGVYEFINALQDGIWKAMLKSDPSKVMEWSMRELIEAWSENYPEEWKKCVGDEASAKLSKLQEQYEFQVRVNERR